MKPKFAICFAATLLWGCAGAQIAPAEERDAYLPQIELTDVRVGKTMTGRFNVYGQVHNNGDRPLADVVLKIDWLDESGNPVGSTTESCISETLGAKTVREFKIPVDGAPETWAQKVNVRVAELAFGS